MSKATEQLKEKEYYHELTPKQQSVIDAYAERPEASHTAIQRIANAKLKDAGLSITRSYVPVILDKYEEIAKEKRKQEENSRTNGEATFIGEPQIPQALMHEGEDKEVTIALTASEIKALADEELPQSIRMKMIRPFLKE